ncbi:hypothetical protein ACP70R_045248 [Stipagrostis hirtigluma subsp. patula]
MSSPPKKPDDKGGVLSPVAVERVVTFGGTVELPMLTATNYHVWSLVMKVSLEALGLWHAVELDKVDRREDRQALAAILRGVPSEMKAGLTVKETAKEAWAAVKSMRMGDNHVRDANPQTLLKQFENMAWRDGESLDAFSMRLMALVRELRELGEAMEDERAVEKMLRVVPAKFNQVAVSIEMLMDLSKVSMEELVGRLSVAEDRINGKKETDGESRLLLTEDQWEARRRSGKERARGGEARHDGDARRGGSNGNKDNDDDDDGGSSTCSGRSERRNRGRCFNCGVRGHIAKYCRSLRGCRRGTGFALS